MLQSTNNKKDQKSSRWTIFFLSLCFVPALVFCVSALTPRESAQAQSRAPQNGPESFADMVDTLLPAVVNISSTQKLDPNANNNTMPDVPQFPPGSPFEQFFQDFMNKRGEDAPAVPATSLGSGFVIDAENGYIITNNHVVQDADKVRVTLHNDETIDAEVIGIDDKTDIAVLKVKTTEKLHAVKFGDSDGLRVGDWVVAIGNPFGLGGTVTAGIVSARQRDINAGPYDDFIQTDASINRGNSGGPMFNLKGEVIGINTAIFSPSGGSVGIGFAIPSSLAKPVVDQIIKFGRTRRGWLGVRIQSITPDIAESLKLGKAHGALVAEVTKGGPAEAAGLAVGDVILSFNGQPIDDMRKLPRLVAETSIGSKGTVVYYRAGKEATTSVMVGELEKAEDSGLIADSNKAPEEEASPGQVIDSVGVKVAALSDPLRKTYNIPPTVTGVVVTAVTANSESERKGLVEGDVIVAMNQQDVKAPADVEAAIKQAQTDKRGSILLLLSHEGEVRFVALKLSGTP